MSPKKLAWCAYVRYGTNNGGGGGGGTGTEFRLMKLGMLTSCP